MAIRSIFLFALIAFGSLSALAQKDGDAAALKAVIDRMTAAQTAYDAAGLDRVFTADFIEISPVGEFDPREKVLSFYSPEAKAQSGGVKVDIAKDYRSIRTYGSTAVVIVEFTYNMSKDGKSLPSQKMMVTAVGRKEGGNWKIASIQYTGIRPPKPPPTILR
jgi:uncharacterized protein (TIGR02246 family)